jgi:hypothetical protein
MASVTPRLSGLWSDEYLRVDNAMGNEDGDDAERQQLWDEDGRTPLDRTIDRIGMGEWLAVDVLSGSSRSSQPCRVGSYQWMLLALCGFGECTAVSLHGARLTLDLYRVDGRQRTHSNMIVHVMPFDFARLDVDTNDRYHPSPCTATLLR